MASRKRPRDEETPLQAAWNKAFQSLPAGRQVALVRRRAEYGQKLLLDADTLPKDVAQACVAQTKAWCGPAGTSVAVARAGSGGFPLAFADNFDIVHAFEGDEARCRYLKANVDSLPESAAGRWIVVHGAATDEEGDYLFSTDDMECDVVFVPLLCANHDVEADAAKRHEPAEDFCAAAEMILQQLFEKETKLVVLLLQKEIELPKIYAACAGLKNCTPLAPHPVTAEFMLQPLKLGRWGANLASHKPLPTAPSPQTATAAAAPASGGGGGGKPLQKFFAVEKWVKRCLIRHAALLARSGGRDPDEATAGAIRGAPPLVALDVACGRGTDLQYYREAGGFGHMVVFDADEAYVARCAARYNKQKWHTQFGLTTVVGDAGAARPPLPPSS